MEIGVPTNHEMKGSLITLRTTRAEDYDQLGEILNDKETMKSLIRYFQKDRWTGVMVKKRYEKFHKEQQEGTGLSYSVILNANGRVVGNCGLKHLSLLDKKAEFGLILDKTVWGTGISKECHFLCLQYAFDVLGLSIIYFITDEHNERMKGFFAKIDIPFKERSPDAYLHYELSKDNWTAVKKHLGR